jgi:hypothetical protein
MFNLEQAIAEWRQQMLSAGIQSPVPLEELESHLREEIERQIKVGADGQQAFETAATNLGHAKPLEIEFKRVETENWNHPLAWSAWVLFVISFFLPAHRWGGWGWQCAWNSAGGLFSSEFWHDIASGDLIAGSVHTALLTFANLLMIVSPFLLPRFSQDRPFIKYWRGFSFLALALVWSFMFRLQTDDHRADIKISCYVWTMSFLLLFLSTLKMSRRTSRVVAN